MEKSNDNTLVSKKYGAYVKTPVYWIPRLLLMLLGIVHDFTKYKVCRSFQDLFYWPEGFCWDTVVVYLFFTVSLWCIMNDCSFIIKCKLSEIKQLMDEIDYDLY